MKRGPDEGQLQRPARKPPAKHLKIIHGNTSLKLPIAHVEMRAIVIALTDTDADGDSVELADCRH